MEPNDRSGYWPASLTTQLIVVFAGYLIAGKLGQATTSIRSSNLGPVWPAYGIAVAALLAYGSRMAFAVAASAFVVAASSPVPPLAALGQAAGAAAAAWAGATALRRIPGFTPSLSRLRDALGLIVIGAFGSAAVSATVGLFSLFVTHVQAYSGLRSAWLIYWLGDSTGVLLVTPLLFALPGLFRIRSQSRRAEGAALTILLVGACLLIFGDLSVIPVRLHVLSFAVLPFVMWAAIDFGVGGASVAVFVIATIATLATALGFGPFAGTNAFTNAVLLDVLFVVLAVTGLVLAALIAERQQAEAAREQLLREQSAFEARLHMATIVESSNDAIYSKNLDGIMLSWNGAAHRTFGFAPHEVIGRPVSMFFPSDFGEEDAVLWERMRRGEPIQRHETTRITKAGHRIDVALTMSPLTDGAGTLIGAAVIARDITDQRRAREALSTVSRRLIHAQEEERSRIARELHDDIGQRLALLAANLSMLPAEVASRPASTSGVSLQQQAIDIAAGVQALSHELHSSKIDLLGVAVAMKGYCEEFAERQKVVVRFSARPDGIRCPSNVSLCLFRVLQEALGNAAKHSGVREFEVQLVEAPQHVELRVGDGGTGFDMETARTARGLGLVSMAERLKLVNGELSVETGSGQGTTVHARVPRA